MGVEHTQGSGTTHLYSVNTGAVGHGSKVKRYDLAVARKGKSILGLPLKLFWGKCLAGNDIPPKRWKYELESLGACHRS